MKKNLVNSLAILTFWLSAITTIGILGVLIGDIVIKGLPVVNFKFIFTSPHGITMSGGIFPTIVATFYLTILTTLVVSPLAVGAAIFLSEYAKRKRLVKIIRFGADSLASVPSIVFGLFGLSLFVYILGLGWSMLSGALTLTLMVLPIIMRTSEEAIRSVPMSYRLGSFGLGATKWQTVRRVVLPTAAPRILTGVILGIGRIFGETAAVIFTAGLAINMPILPTESGRTMTNHLYLLAVEGISMRTAYGTAFLLIIFILIFNFIARRIAYK